LLLLATFLDPLIALGLIINTFVLSVILLAWPPITFIG
jgi:hypothetical protein